MLNLSKIDALKLVDMPLDELVKLVANEAESKHIPAKHTKSLELCGIINAKSGKCSEDCKFCTQSSFYKTSTSEYPLLAYDKVYDAAKLMQDSGVHRFCIVMSGRKPTESQVATLCDYFEKLNKDVPNLKYCVSFGFITKEYARQLKDAGLTRYHHNLETSLEYYEQVCTTHEYHERIESLHTAKENGLETCSGGIVGMGENWEDRIGLMDAVRSVNPNSVTLNILNPMPNTPFEKMKPLSNEEILRIIAIYKLMLNNTSIRFCAGRQRMEYDRQFEAIEAGLSALMVGDYLTISGLSLKDDLKKYTDIGYKFAIEETTP